MEVMVPAQVCEEAAGIPVDESECTSQMTADFWQSAIIIPGAMLTGGYNLVHLANFQIRAYFSCHC